MKRNNRDAGRVDSGGRRKRGRGGPLILLVLLALLVHACAPESEDDYFTRVDQYFYQGRFEQAVAVCKDYLNDFPDGKYRDQALFRAGEIKYYALGDRLAGIKDLGLLISRRPSSAYAYQAHEVLAGFFRDEYKDYNRAILEFKLLINQQPRNPQASYYQFQAARCFILAGKLEQAITEFGALIEKYPDSELVPQAFDELAGAYMALGRPEEAFNYFSKLLDRFPSCAFRLAVEFKMGHCLEEMNRFKEALELYAGLLPRYHNPRAIEIRIAGVEERLKNKKLGSAKVDYNYRPRAGAEKESDQRPGKNEKSTK
ncbi:MAG: tetratricopeptide repeat protein [Pseudomonadota bacterium]